MMKHYFNEEEKDSTFERCPHDAENPYIMINRELARNCSISFQARGFLLYLLSHKTGWKINREFIMKSQKVSRYSLKKMVDELIEAGFISMERYQAEKGYRRIKYLVSEIPKFKINIPRFEIPHEEFPQEEKRPLKKEEEEKKEQYKEDPPLPPPPNPPPKPKPKEEEDAFVDHRGRTLLNIVGEWKKQGRSEEIIVRAMSEYHRQPRGKIKCIKEWMEAVYIQKSEEEEGQKILRRRRKYARLRAEKQPQNFAFCPKKDILYYTSGAIQTPYPINQESEFWREHAKNY